MEEIKLAPTQKTPSVTFTSAGLLELKGRSIPENSLEFYKPLIDWVESYGRTPAAETNVHVQLEYFNTSSSKCLLDFFKRLESLSSKVTIHWYYEQDDEDMLEAGEDYEAIINVPFKMIEVEELSS
jgi:SiaC family regulatory phosphoprotein